MRSWLKLDPHCPEYGKYNAQDLTDWVFEYERYNKREEKEFHHWLNSIPLGVITPIPQHEGYSVVAVQYSRT